MKLFWYRAPSLTIKVRSGFTLIELLVTVSIFVILLAITASAFNVNQDREKISAGARQLQSAFEGARSRAFKLGRPVGLRFAVDSNDPTVSPSMTYIQQLEPIRGKLDVMRFNTINGQQVSEIRIRSLQQPPDDDRPPDGDYDDDGIIDNGDVTTIGVPTPPNYNPDGIYDYTPPGSLPNPASWTSGDMGLLVYAVQQGLITPGVVIRIRSGGTNYGEYRIVASNSTSEYDPSRGVFHIFPRFHSPMSALDTIAETNPQWRVRQSLDFEIIPTPIALQGEDPLVLPEGVVIEWDSSAYPREWAQITSAQVWQAGMRYSIGQWMRSGNYFLKCVDFGTSGSTIPTPTSVNQIIKDGTVYWRSYNFPQLDLMFSPRGSTIGSVATNGLIHFGLAYRRDTDLQELNSGVVRHSIFDVRTKPDGTYFFNGEHRIVTLFLQSGAVSTNEPDFTDDNPADNIADHPFSYAVVGGETK